MVKVMDKKIITILCKLFLLNWPYENGHVCMGHMGQHTRFKHLSASSEGSDKHVHPCGLYRAFAGCIHTVCTKMKA